MTSTPTPEPERQWVCHKPGWMGPCSPQSTHHNGFDWGCGWIYFPAPSTPGEGAGRPDTAALRYMAKVSRGRVNNRVDWERTLLDAADWIDTQPPASPADDVPDADAVAFQNGYRIGVRVGSEHHGPCRGLPPASPVPPTRPLILDDGEVTLTAEGDGYVLTVQINEAGDSVSHRLTAAEVAAFAAVPPTRPGADAVIRALIAACPSYGRGEGDTFHIEESAVVRMAREFLAVAPPTPTPCPYIVTGGEGTSYCSLAERSAIPPTPTPQADRDKLEIDVEELLIDHCGMGGTSALTDRILALTDAFTFAAASPSTPAEQPDPDGLSAAELLADLKDRTERGMVELEKLAAPLGACMERTRLLGKLAGLALVADWLRSYDHPTDPTGSEA